jgi:superfamily II DNA/RNA helicase
MLFDIYYLLDAISVTFDLPTDATDVARAGRAGRAGTRVGRLLKIVRMIRVFRVAKLYKETKRAIDEQRKIIRKNTLNKRASRVESDSLSQDESKSDYFISQPSRLLRSTTFQDKKRPTLARRRLHRDSLTPSTDNDKSNVDINRNVSNITELGIITNNDI